MSKRANGMFEKAGYRALSAADTTSALRLLQAEPCDLVVVDLALSEVDGLAFCRLLRAQPATSKLPVIGLSDDDSDSQKQQAFAAGADECIAKSSSAAEIVSRSAAHLRAAQREWELIDSNRELRFLADLGRGLLRTLELDQLVNRVAGATYEGTSAAMCAAFISLGDDSEAACVFDREGSAEGIALLQVDRLKSWLTASTSSSVAPLLISEPNNFLLHDDAHRVEYAAPLRFGGRPKGALLTHRGLRKLQRAQGRELALRRDDRVLQFAAFSFDAAIPTSSRVSLTSHAVDGPRIVHEWRSYRLRRLTR